MKKQIKPITKNQIDYVRSIAENDFVICHGPPGTGKSFLSTGLACQYLEEGKVEKIVITRPMVQSSGRDTIGFLKGGLDEKISPFMIPILSHLNYFMGAENTTKMRQNGLIEFLPLELSRGMNLYNSFVLVDESQNMDYDQIKMMLTRICKGSKIVMNGDPDQTDLRNHEGSNYCCDFEECIDRLNGLDGFGIVKMTSADIQRNKMIKSILNRLE